jgi:hypothetical protein
MRPLARAIALPAERGVAVVAASKSVFFNGIVGLCDCALDHRASLMEDSVLLQRRGNQNLISYTFQFAALSIPGHSALHSNSEGNPARPRF